MSVLHVVCRAQRGVTWESDTIFVSASWPAQRLNINTIALHQTKNAPSYIQGRVLDSWDDPERPSRKIFRALWFTSQATWPQPMCAGSLQYGTWSSSFPANPALLENIEDLIENDEEIASPDSLYVMAWQGVDSRVKIGRSRDPSARARRLSAGHPDVLCVIKTWQGMGYLERFVHDALSARRVQNGGSGREWFQINAQVAVCCIDIMTTSVVAVATILDVA